MSFLAKKAEKKEENAEKKAEEKHSHKAEEKAKKDSHKAKEDSHKAEKKHASKDEKHEKKIEPKGEEEPAEEHGKRHAEKNHKEEAAYAEEEAGHAKKGHVHAAEEEEMSLEEAVSGETEGHVEHEKNRRPKKGKHQKRDFVELKPAEITEAIVHLANEGHSASEIGMILRDQYGVPMVGKAMGKKLCAILREHSLLPPIPDDMMSLIRKSVTLREHLAKNKKDMSAKRGLMLTVSKIKALEKYYKQKGVLPMEWRYSAETASLLAK